MYGSYKSPFGYESGINGGVDSYGVDHSGFSTQDELQYQTARAEREKQLAEGLQRQGVAESSFPQYGANFWGNSANNYGFGVRNIAQNAQNHPAMSMTPAMEMIPKLPSYDNHLTASQRIQALKNGEKLRLYIDENSQVNGDWKSWCNLDKGSIAVNKYSDVIDKYANKYNIDSDLVKSIMFAENACGNYYGANQLADFLGLSKSQLPMNIRGDIWSNF